MFGVLSLIVLLTGMTLFSLAHPGFLFYLAFVALIAGYLILSYFIGITGKGFDLEAHNNYPEHLDYTPTIDVYLPTCGEPIEILANSYLHVRNLVWPRKEVWVLDDAGRSEVKDLAERQGFRYICRDEPRELKKAGNIRNAFRLTGGELILILDADFCPRMDFITEVVKYFKDPKTAIVQTPQFFRIDQNEPWIQKGAAFVQELFYRLIQVSRDHFGAAICVGTSAIYRRSALIPFGGTAPIQYSEDLHTGHMLLSSGYRIRYLPIALSAGQCPDRISSYITQQYRWCMGSISLMLSRPFWRSNMTRMQRACYCSGALYYIATGVGVLFTPLPAILLSNFKPEFVYWYSVIFSLPSFIFGTVYLARWSKQPFGLYALKARNLSYYSHLLALKDKLTGDLMPWVPTGNGSTNAKVKNVILICRVWSVVSTSLVIFGAYSNWSYNFIPMLAFSSLSCYIAISSTLE